MRINMRYRQRKAQNKEAPGSSRDGMFATECLRAFWSKGPRHFEHRRKMKVEHLRHLSCHTPSKTYSLAGHNELMSLLCHGPSKGSSELSSTQATACLLDDCPY
jgi:hypothetical protein